jgi:hypothetical protein
MILVNSDGKDDYAIMKQVQQIKLLERATQVVSLESQPNISGIGRNEKLYVVSHGTTANFFRGYVEKDGLVGYLMHAQSGLPQNFNGDIIILSCYGGNKPYSSDSIAEYVAKGLSGRAASGTVVTGAIGYSFGTPEFQHSGRSSVLRDSAFYLFGNLNGLVDTWLKLTPTHTGGVLKDKLHVNVDTGKTIKELIATLQGSLETPEQIAARLITEFTSEAEPNENTLGTIIRRKIPGTTVAARADYLVDMTGEDPVKEWNAAIEKQYKLYGDYYLWVTPPNGFTVTHVP